MARSINVIQQAIVSFLVTALAAVGITLDPSIWSDYDYRQLISFIVSSEISVHEQLWDSFSSDMDVLIATIAPQTPLWLQNFVLNIFQYSVTTPQIVQFDVANIVPYYPTIDPTLRIVTQCAILPGIFGTTTIRVAKQSPGVPLEETELNALNSALATISVPGIIINATSDNADKLFVVANITYNGQYSAIVSATVISAITVFLASIPTVGIVAPTSPVGIMRLTGLIQAIKNVPGVIDVEMVNVNVRADVTTFPPSSFNLVNNKTWIQTDPIQGTIWNSGTNGAGYIVPETTTGYTFTDPRADGSGLLNLNFVAQ